ncbi:hypothetical protein [Spirosoma areae]
MITLTNPDQIAGIASVQKRRLADLQQLPRWSNSQFYEVLIYTQSWDDQNQQWAHEVEAIHTLAFDLRVPDGYAHKLQNLLEHWTTTNQLT